MKFKKQWVAVVLAMVFSASMLSVVMADDAKEDKKYTIAFIPQFVGNTYFEVSNQGAQAAAEEMGVEVIYTAPTVSDPVLQTNTIEDMITRGVDCIAVSPVDPEAQATVLKKAQDAGILVVTWDSDVNDPTARSLYVTYCIDKEFGEHLGEELAKEMGGEGEYAIITSVFTVQNNAAWSESATEYISENYPDMTRVAYEPCDDDAAKAYTVTQNLMTGYPNLKGILGVTTVAPPASAQAIQDAGRNGEIKCVGLVEPSVANEYLKSDAMQEAIIWHPGKLGYLTIWACNQLLNGESVLDTPSLDYVGKIVVDSEDKILMDEMLYIRADTVDDYDF